MEDEEAGTATPFVAERLVGWRQTAAHNLARVLGLLSLPATLWVAHDGVRLGRWPIALVAVAFQLSNGVCALAPLRLVTRARWLLSNLVLAALLFLPLTGHTGGLGALAVLTPLVAVLLLGAREALRWMLLLGCVNLFWLLLWSHGVVERPHGVITDVGLVSNVGRAAFVSFCIGALALVATAYVLRKLVATLFEAEQLLASQRKEIEAREQEAARRQRAEAELLRSQKVEALGQVAGGVAHDVNNNLTIALVNAELIERRARGDATTLALCKALRESIDGAAVLTRQLLAFGRRDVVRPSVVSVESALRRVRTLAPSVLGKSRALTIEVQDDLPPVLVDLRQLEQVLLNLVLNARDAMPAGGALRVRVESHDPPPAYRFVTSPHAPPDAVRIHVSDDGTGMTDDVLSQIFEPFFTTKGPDVGTGLGLAVARAFAEHHGGRLGVRTAPGHGSTITLELPAAAPDERVAPLHSDVAPARPAHILVVDDDERIRALIVTELRALGHHVVEASDGSEALKQARSLPELDLVCTDAMMPGLSGERLLQVLGDERPGLRVLVISAYVGDLALRQRLQRGQHFVLPKPFSSVELRDAVRHALSAQVAGREEPAA